MKSLIFLHFMNEEIIKYKNSTNSLTPDNERKIKKELLNKCLLISGTQCLIPPSFIMESDINFTLFKEYVEFFKKQQIAILIKEDNIDAFFIKKEHDYRNLKDKKHMQVIILTRKKIL